MADAKHPTLVLASQLEALEDARAWLRGGLAEADLAEDWTIDLELALTEALSNVIRHAYGGEGHHEIHVTLALAPESVTVIVRDFGQRFERERLPPVELDSAHEGGYGVFLIESLVDEVAREPAQPHGTRLSLTKIRPRREESK